MFIKCIAYIVTSFTVPILCIETHLFDFIGWNWLAEMDQGLRLGMVILRLLMHTWTFRSNGCIDRWDVSHFIFLAKCKLTKCFRFTCIYQLSQESLFLILKLNTLCKTCNMTFFYNETNPAILPTCIVTLTYNRFMLIRSYFRLLPGTQNLIA